MSKNKNQAWSNSKLYYAVLTGCLMLIIGVSAAIYNVSLNKALPSQKADNTSEVTPFSTTSERSREQANMQATGIPKPSQTQPTTISVKKLPYKGEFIAPVSGKVIGEFSFGEMVKNETMGDWRVHDGVDFAANENENVLSVQDGIVETIDINQLWGVCIETLCPGGLTVRYCGLQENPSVKIGDKIKKGDIIGKVGKVPIELNMPTHIHIETIIDKKCVNPLDALNLI